MKCKSAKVAVFGKIPCSLLIPEGTGTDLGFARFPVKAGNAFEGGEVSAVCALGVFCQEMSLLKCSALFRKGTRKMFIFIATLLFRTK